ncbi:MAG: RES family NAD+ phosphorylase [Myxococcales bacterium]|nr:RES family NAD+ phosphorylase [Myxococcales bacterium]MCB9579076.1 RES family NAD+ phosphorylase [Polyangiaceae bacterium]
MTTSLWKRLRGEEHVRRLTSTPWRVVEAQHVISTRKLVDSDEEQRVLEELLEQSKPPTPKPAARLHYLLSTSFRYPPLRHGSRFGTRQERGIWYGAETLVTAFAEVAYYRLVLLEGTQAKLEPLMVELSAFRASVKARHGVDLTRPPFLEHAPRISSRSSYAISQRLGRDMRSAGVQAFRYVSSRDPDGGACLAVMDPGAFSSPSPSQLSSWLCVATKERVEVSDRGFFERRAFAFERSRFVVRGELPTPAV